MPANGNRRDDGLDDLDHVCFHCPAPDCWETWQWCPLVRVARVRQLEQQSGNLVGAVSTVYLAALLDEDVREVRKRAERGEFGPARQVGRFWCVGAGAIEDGRKS